MIVGSILENTSLEKRVAITPDTVKKYKSLGIDINLSKNYASHLGISDKVYQEEGATIFNTDREVIENSSAILQMSLISCQCLREK